MPDKELNEQQKAYVAAVEEWSKGYTNLSTGFCASCADCRDDLGFSCEHKAQHEVDANGIEEEGRFSRETCDLCRTTLGGNRYRAHGRDEKKELVHFEVCVDCLFFITYGEAPEEWKQHAE